ncbi:MULTISPECIES: FAD-dependent oxidoreductase [unclassified Rhodococcus (in: high G+C Gram-positive bacteria)]|uniref:flavin monoamine oxidase family protein n=1 Tax=unclassified Rhodococcus (in: high G+C Gram-positive bacteria) TaxID=192944 RepID=UPI00163B4CED|nr:MULTISPECIES: FAD-dependent oxidoreductase [unclassified Rhodococcus (in: high G+C Gram-positive bacteria)]MBC2639141.1 FAD-dependent oxidoreductase [Rhodococcus sp. 3A]MBC2896117.1 FAD-dependent oxidoreductase [Rhodococcus sp. 4CII]
MADIEVDCCVVGAGFAGLTAALRVKQAGHSVALMEARNRIGGRTFTEIRDDGSWIDRGGAWIGPGQDRIYALMDEFGVKSYKQYTDGEAMMVVGGKQYRYKGTIPWTMSPWAAANLGAVFVELGEMCKTIPLDAPWEAKKAAKWDSISLAKWLSDNTASKPAHDLLETAIAGCYTSAASEVSMLFVLYQMASGGGPSFVLGVKDAAEDARPVGGMGAVYRPMAAEIGDSLHLSQPVRDIVQDDDGVTVRSADMAVRARRVIVAVPLAIASHILYEPLLPMDRSFLHQRMPSGAVSKIAVLYDEPFWRADGLSGQSAAPESPATITIDASTDTGRPGVLCVIVEGPVARRMGRLSVAERKSAVLGELTARFGSKAASPVDYIEQNWSVERYSGGGMLSHAPTGVLTQFGHTLREPCGRIHWAGTESSSVMCGWVDGAVRSGERAAREVTAQ